MPFAELDCWEIIRRMVGGESLASRDDDAVFIHLARCTPYGLQGYFPCRMGLDSWSHWTRGGGEHDFRRAKLMRATEGSRGEQRGRQG